MLGKDCDYVNRLVVFSDRGMVVGWIDGDKGPGSHGWQAMFGTTESKPLPKDIYDVREWLEEQKSDHDGNRDTTSLGMAREPLKELGYL